MFIEFAFQTMITKTGRRYLIYTKATTLKVAANAMTAYTEATKATVATEATEANITSL